MDQNSEPRNRNYFVVEVVVIVHPPLCAAGQRAGGSLHPGLVRRPRQSQVRGQHTDQEAIL